MFFSLAVSHQATAPRSSPPQLAPCGKSCWRLTPVSSPTLKRSCPRRPLWKLSSCTPPLHLHSSLSSLSCQPTPATSPPSPNPIPNQTIKLIPNQPRTRNPLHNRINPPLLPTFRRPSNPPPPPNPRLPHRPPNHPNRPRRNPLCPLGCHTHGSRPDVPGRPPA
jgi:hypothetical protein